ncbi:MAG: DUF4167 domain-containing protein [Caulobacteraceae bacterium]
MRDFKGMKRQRGRNRNGGGGGGGGGGKPQHNTNRAFDSNGPEGVKVRGAAQHVYEKYQQMARDAHTVGDRVLAENHLQHAEHYFRVMRAMQPLRPVSDIIGRDQFVSGYDIDFEDESGAGAEAGEGENESETNEADGGAEGQQPRFDQRRDAWQRDDRGQNDRGQNDRGQSDRPAADRFQGERGQAQGDRPREDRAPRTLRDERPRYNQAERPRYERSDRDSATDTDQTRAPEPHVSGSATPGQPASMLRADDGDVSHAPAFLQVRPAETGEEARRPRRRRAPRTFEGAEAPPASDDKG